PYLRRPADPQSAFSAMHATSDGDGPTRCSTQWNTRALVGLPYRVWVCDDPAALSGLSARDAMDMVANILIEYAPQLIADMGAPIPDDPTMQPGEIADDLIDVYALPTGWLGPYRENISSMPTYALTVQA